MYWSTAIQVRRARPAEAPRSLAVLTRAFESDPMIRWAFPDDRRYRTHFPQFARGFGGPAFGRGTADRAEDFDGVALWLPPGAAPDAETTMAALEAGAEPTRMMNLRSLFERMAPVHPREPHWYLPLIGVDLTRQGQGVGTALMRHATERIDRTGLPAYLESTDPARVPFYHRFGFEPVGGGLRAGDSPELVPMFRPGRKGGAGPAAPRTRW